MEVSDDIIGIGTDWVGHYPQRELDYRRSRRGIPTANKFERVVS